MESQLTSKFQNSSGLNTEQGLLNHVIFKETSDAQLSPTVLMRGESLLPTTEYIGEDGLITCTVAIWTAMTSLCCTATLTEFLDWTHSQNLIFHRTERITAQDTVVQRFVSSRPILSVVCLRRHPSTGSNRVHPFEFIISNFFLVNYKSLSGLQW